MPLQKRRKIQLNLSISAHRIRTLPQSQLELISATKHPNGKPTDIDCIRAEVYKYDPTFAAEI